MRSAEACLCVCVCVSNKTTIKAKSSKSFYGTASCKLITVIYPTYTNLYQISYDIMYLGGELDNHLRNQLNLR